MAAARDFLGNVAQLKEARARLRLSDKSAHARDAGENTIGRQLPERTVGGHAGNVEPLDKLVLRGHARAGRQAAGADLTEDVVLHAPIERLGLVHVRLPRMSTPSLITAAQGLKPSG